MWYGDQDTYATKFLARIAAYKTDAILTAYGAHDYAHGMFYCPCSFSHCR